MAEYIDRQKAIVQTSKAIKDDSIAYDVKEVLKSLPSADVRPNTHGTWLVGFGHAYCNCCGYKASPILTNFCPNCGVRMV